MSKNKSLQKKNKSKRKKESKPPQKETYTPLSSFLFLCPPPIPPAKGKFLFFETYMSMHIRIREGRSFSGQQ